MDIVIDFKNHLLAQKQKPSKLTVKNYVSDVKKFIQWYENAYATTFYPQFIKPNVISQYSSYLLNGTENSMPATRSSKRYLSSLRKFCGFLEESGTIEENPFPKEINPQRVIDPYYLKDFKNFLYTEQARKLTIKNYMADIKQFVEWLERVIVNDPEARTSSPMSSIDNFSLEQYKVRLLQEAQLSPVSINRKLSSLRRYMKWLQDKGLIYLQRQEPEKIEEETKHEELPVQSVIPDIPLTALQGMVEENENQIRKYSSFAPFRLVQKTSRIISLGSELLFFSPIAHIAEAIHYSVWKKGEKEIFVPVTNILESSSYIPQGVSIKTIIPKASSILPPKTASLASIAGKLRTITTQEPADTTVHNFTKGLYAPLRISTKHMHWQQKLIYNLRYSRPAWYKKYHEFAFVQYLHFGILII